MSDVEQITKEPSPSPKAPREKDPKKVAAGKKLAAKHKRNQEAYDREMKREAEAEAKKLEVVVEEESPDDGSQTWIPELSFSTVISLIGVGIAAIDLYMRYKNSKGEHFDWQPVTTVVSREPVPAPPSKIPVPTPTQSNEVVPKIGMS